MMRCDGLVMKRSRGFENIQNEKFFLRRWSDGDDRWCAIEVPTAVYFLPKWETQKRRRVEGVQA